jgi:two-component system nitrogen regulation sensor histidine kinase NtrY
MIAPATPVSETDDARRWPGVTPAVEMLAVATAVVIAIGSYFIIARDTPDRLMAPPLIAFLLVANLVSGVVILMLVGRRIARRRAETSQVGGGGRLHVRLVALFSVMAAVPMLLVTIFASLLFQYGVQFWYSDKARSMLENAAVVARESYNQQLQRWEQASITMADDMSQYLRERPIDGGGFDVFFLQQIYYRSLSEGALFAVSPKSGIQTLAVVNPYARNNLAGQLTPAVITALRSGKPSVVKVTGDRIQTITMLPGSDQYFLYAARVGDNRSMAAQTSRADAISSDYRSLLARSRSLQLQFNAALLIISLSIVGLAVAIALAVADRLVRPVGELVSAARKVASGDLTARVPNPRSPDEVGMLATAFNTMTGRLEQQNSALVNANAQLDARRALIEAVMSGVSAGVIAVGGDGVIRIANLSASLLLAEREEALVGQPLAAISPELADLIVDSTREAIVEVGRTGEVRTLAVRIAHTDAGPILTFDDITQQVLDQRRAAWSDVARRIAHEIKNPLTPIQLAAERLKRRYGAKIEDDGTFTKLTDTIVRQVGDLRRMVDEFSSFARMPKPVFRPEGLLDIARQALFLHEVAHPDIRFTLEDDAPGVELICDRRQIGQALTNIVKNAVEAIEARGGDAPHGAIEMMLSAADVRTTTITVVDNGIGLPPDRDRIVEPYMTTRARGTGLGLAIVKKIVEEHAGTMSFSDTPGGGTTVTMTFDNFVLASRDESGVPPEPAHGQLALLSRNRT